MSISQLRRREYERDHSTVIVLQLPVGGPLLAALDAEARRPAHEHHPPGWVATATSPSTLSVPEAAAQLGISRSHAYDLVRAKELPHLRLGRRIVIPRAQLEAWILDHGERVEALETG
jgi:excisionase family DNA binding protein